MTYYTHRNWGGVYTIEQTGNSIAVSVVKWGRNHPVLNQWDVGWINTGPNVLDADNMFYFIELPEGFNPDDLDRDGPDQQPPRLQGDGEKPV